MEGDRKLSLVVGAFVIATLAAFAFVILTLSADRGFFREYFRLTARFENVQGLLPNAPVWLAGKHIGRVEQVAFAPVGSDKPLEVVMSLDAAVQERVRGDSVATIGTIGVLGDSYIEVSVGSLDAEMLANDSEIQAITPANIGVLMASAGNLMNNATDALEGIGELADRLNGVVETFASEGGAKEAVAALKAASTIVLKVQQGPGLLHSVIYDEYDGGGVESIEKSLASLEDILKEVRDGEGVLHTLIYDPFEDQDLVVQVLEAGARLNNILAKMDRGEGTIGMLMNDPTLYEDLKILLGGAQRSTVVRTLIRLSTEE